MTIRQQTTSQTAVRRLVQVNGIVQGIGFRPFVHHLAQEFGLSGWVRNTGSGVEMSLQGQSGQLDTFLTHLQSDAPPPARIISIDTWPVPVVAGELPGLAIRPSEEHHNGTAQPLRTLISPDIATCPKCLGEFEVPADRRHHYPFTNCTHCGPRFTIIEALPFDRPLTTMAQFPLCPACKAEFESTYNRRFHAQVIACPDCGPIIWFVPSNDAPSLPPPESCGDGAFWQVSHYLNDGRIIAIKGIGGFHLACRADLETAVARLREAKARPDKPLAIMVAGIEMAKSYCQVNSAEERLLASPEAPIVLLQTKAGRPSEQLARLIAPQNSAVGVMLPYTPFHHLLLQTVNVPLVMTSGNRPGEPLCTGNEEAWNHLRPMCDGFLFHNRPIARRCDDSVVFAAVSLPTQAVRRSRGYVPVPLLLPSAISLAQPLAAAGADLKNVSAVAVERQVFLTQHVGNLDNLPIRAEQAAAVADLERLFHIEPQALVCDLHPDYASSRYARERAAKDNLKLIEVQHHQAHIAGCLAENGQTGPAIGLAFDGTGYGTDGRIWGGEVLLSDLADFKRLYHLEYLPLPGGDAAVKRPYRAAIAYLLTLCPHVDVASLFPHISSHEFDVIEAMLDQNLNCPLTSSMGRLFDVVGAMLGLCLKVSYEAQAAIALEAAARQSEVNGRYYFSLEENQIRLGRLLFQIAADRLRGAPVNNIARRFHNTIAALACFVAERVRTEKGQDLPVALSGGVWQNRLLLELTVPQLRQAGFEVLLHSQVPANDGGLAYGQTAVAAARLKM